MGGAYGLCAGSCFEKLPSTNSTIAAAGVIPGLHKDYSGIYGSFPKK